MKAKTNHLISQVVSFFSNLAVSASGLNETTDVKKLVTVFFYVQLPVVAAFAKSPVEIVFPHWLADCKI